MDAVEAKELGFSQMTVDSVEEMLKAMEIEHYEIVRIHESWSETMVRFITKISPILMMIGLGALYTEIKSPGFGVPGILGIICLGLVFFSQHLVGLANYTEFLMIVLGIALLMIELFVLPGFGIAAVAGLVLMTVGMILALQDFVIPNPDLPWQGELLAQNMIQVLSAAIAGLIIAMLFIRYVIPRLSTVVDGPYLRTTLQQAHADSMESKMANAGDTGITVTFLRPSGKIEIKGELVDAISESEYIEKGIPVIVLRVEGNRVIVVRKAAK
jgi:membrane-bound serine protease (ClpP class)